MSFYLPENVRAALVHLRDKFTANPVNEVNVDWARRIIAKKNRGETVSPTVLQMARDVLHHPTENEGSEP